MKVLSKLTVSLALTSALTNVALAEDAMGESSEYGKVTGEAKAAYYSSNFLGQKKTDTVMAAGGNVNYISPNISGLTFGATAQFSALITGEDDINNAAGATTQYQGFYINGANLPEVYGNYAIDKTNIKVGRQYITTPLVSSALDGKSSESIIKDSFQAAIISTEIAKTTITFGYVNMYQSKEKGDKDKIGEFKDYGDGAMTVHVSSKAIENLTLQAQYLSVKKGDELVTKDKTLMYLQGDVQIGKTTVSAQYLTSDDESKSTSKTGSLLGLRATGALGVGKLGYLVAYNSAGDDVNVDTGAGAGTTDTPFTAMPVHGGGVPTFKGATTMVGAIVIPTEKVTVIPYAGQSSNDKANNLNLGNVKAMGAIAIAPINKELLVKANYEQVTAENAVVAKKDSTTTRVYVSYKF